MREEAEAFERERQAVLHGMLVARHAPPRSHEKGGER